MQILKFAAAIAITMTPTLSVPAYACSWACINISTCVNNSNGSKFSSCKVGPDYTGVRRCINTAPCPNSTALVDQNAKKEDGAATQILSCTSSASAVV